MDVTFFPNYISCPFFADLADPDFTCPVFFEAWGNKCYYFQGAHVSLRLAEITCNTRSATPVSESTLIQTSTTTFLCVNQVQISSVDGELKTGTNSSEVL